MQERKKKKKKSEENYLIYIQFIKFNAKKFPREGKKKKKKVHTSYYSKEGMAA